MTHSGKNRIWAYFKQCNNDPSKAKCNLCSAELCFEGTTNILWTHIKSNHSSDRKRTTLSFKNERDQESPSESFMTQSKLRTNFKTPNNTNTINSSNNNNNISNNNYNNSNITTTRSATSGTSSTAKNFRHNLDFIIDYNDLSQTSMKPSASTSSSLSRNLISRLNQLSSPVARKLKFWNKKSFQVNQYDPSFKVIYLGNLSVQLWSKDESCLDKPLSTLWNNYLVNMKTEIVMRLTICNSGLKAITRQHGLTQYWSNRLVYCCTHKNYPRIFSWIYRHEGKKMRQELRCHAVLCPSSEKAVKMVTMLNQRLVCALQEFKREKRSGGSLAVANSSSLSSSPNSLQQKAPLPRTIPLRRQILAKGSANFRPPLERSKSAPKLTSILEEEDYDSDEQVSQDEFEFQESFGDRDSDFGDEDHVEVVEVQDVDDDDDAGEDEDDVEEEGDRDLSIHKNESSSFTITVNEENSTCGRSSHISDVQLDTKQDPLPSDQTSVSGVSCQSTGVCSHQANHNLNGHRAHHNQTDHAPKYNDHDQCRRMEKFNLETKGSIEQTRNDNDLESHINQQVIRGSPSSANEQSSTSSSFRDISVSTYDNNQDTDGCSLNKLGSQKNNNASNNIKEPAINSDGDVSAQEIIHLLVQL